MDYHQELKAVEQEIKALENSEYYQTLKKKNRAWAVPKPTEEEKGEWQELKEELAELKKDKEFWQKAILSTNAAAVKKTDTVRKGYKRETAVKRERQLLNTVAINLYNEVGFEIAYSTPTFGDVKKATGFHSAEDVNNYFIGKKAGKVAATRLNDTFDEKCWIYLVELNTRVNPQMHVGLPDVGNALEVVLENDVFDKQTVTKILAIVEPGRNVDIKNAESDSDKSQQ
jgi:hypothetical protein